MTIPLFIEWHPFQLNPDMPEGGMDRRAYLEGKFGGKEGAVRAYAPVVENAEKAGLSINFDAMKRTPNTLDAHRLIHWAGIEGRQTAAVSALFKAYFEEGLDIGDHEILADIADGIEMDASVVLRLLQSDSDREDIRARDAHSRQMGINSVPTFIVANQHAVPGAQPPDLWVKVIEELKEADQRMIIPTKVLMIPAQGSDTDPVIGFCDCQRHGLLQIRRGLDLDRRVFLYRGDPVHCGLWLAGSSHGSGQDRNDGFHLCGFGCFCRRHSAVWPLHNAQAGRTYRMAGRTAGPARRYRQPRSETALRGLG